MAGYSTPVSLTAPPSTDWQGQQAELQRRQLMAQQLMQQGQEPLGPTQSVGGVAIPQSWTQGLAKVLQSGLGAYQQGQVRNEQRDLSKRYGEAQGTDAQALAAYLRGTPGTPEAMDENMVTTPGTPATAPMSGAMPSFQTPEYRQMLAQMMMKQAEKAGEPYSLREGEKRFGPGGAVTADNPKPQPGFSLSPGQTRYGSTGLPVVAAPEAPYTLAPGAVRMGPNDKPLATAPELPSVVNNRDLIPDGKGGFIPNQPLIDAKSKIAGSGAARQITNVNAFTPASEEAQRDFIKSTRATYDTLKQAPVALESIEKAKALIPSAKGFMGPGGEPLLDAAKFLNNRLGTTIATEGVKSAEELRTRIFFNIMDNLKKMDAQPSQQQQQIMQEALGKLGTDPNALPAVLDAFGDVIKGKVQLHNQEVNGAVQRGVKFPYDPIINLRRGDAGGGISGDIVSKATEEAARRAAARQGTP